MVNNEFVAMKYLKGYIQKTLPAVYDDSLSSADLLAKILYSVNELIKNVNGMPKYIADLIEQYITGGAIGEIVGEVIASFILNVKYPPNDLVPASGDGSTDDTATIQGCIDYASANGGMFVYFPSGRYLTRPLTMKSNVSLGGFDRYNTKLVLMGGSLKPLLTGTCTGVSVTRMTLDGNADVQTEDLNLVELTGSDYLFEELVLTDGYDLMNLVLTGGNVQVQTVVFEHGVENGLVVSGNGEVVASNLVFESLSSLLGKHILDIRTNGAVITNAVSKCEVATPLNITGNDCFVSVKLLNANKTYSDTGLRNDVVILGASEKRNYTGDVSIKAKKMTLDVVEPLVYKNPSAYNEYFKTIPMQGTSGAYDVLVKGESDLVVDLLEITDSVDTVNQRVDDEITARELADGVLQDNIDAEVLARGNADDLIGERITEVNDTLAGSIADEVTARGLADEALGIEIDNEVIARGVADADLQDQIDALANRSVFVTIDEIGGKGNANYFYMGQYYEDSEHTIPATDNAPIIRAYLQTLIAEQRKGRIMFPSGNYVFNSTVRLHGFITFEGEEKDNTYLIYNGVDSMFVCGDRTTSGTNPYGLRDYYLQFFNLTIQPSVEKKGKFIDGQFSYSTIKNCYIRDFDIAFYLDNSWTNNFADCTISGNNVAVFGGRQFNDVMFTNCWFASNDVVLKDFDGQSISFIGGSIQYTGDVIFKPSDVYSTVNISAFSMKNMYLENPCEVLSTDKSNAFNILNFEASGNTIMCNGTVYAFNISSDFIQGIISNNTFWRNNSGSNEPTNNFGTGCRLLVSNNTGRRFPNRDESPYYEPSNLTASTQLVIEDVFYPQAKRIFGAVSASQGVILGDSATSATRSDGTLRTNVGYKMPVYQREGVEYVMQMVVSGTTANRPTYNKPVGFMFYDTTINKPVWWNGTAWITWPDAVEA